MNEIIKGMVNFSRIHMCSIGKKSPRKDNSARITLTGLVTQEKSSNVQISIPFEPE